MALFGRAQIMGGRQTTGGSSDTPLTILGAKLEAWWDGADPEGDGTPPANGSNPSSWIDKSGNAHNLSVVGAPSFQATGLNSKGVLRFDGVDDGYAVASAFIYALGTAQIWAIAKSDESGTGTIIAEGVTTNANAVYRLYDDDTNNDYVWQLTNTTPVDRFANTQDRQTNAWDLVIVTDNGAATGTSNEVVDVDAGTTGAYTRDGPAFSRLAIAFTRRNTDTVWFDGDIAEILVLTSAASSGERTALSSYLNTKWGQSWTPA